MKLNLGDGGFTHPDYIGLDIKRGEDVRNLSQYETGSIDEIRASHILEHFQVRDIRPILREWIRVLKPGGILKIAVPDFKMIAEQYLAGAQIPLQSYIMGAQSDENDFHKCILDDEGLTEAMQMEGLIGIRRWSDHIPDCATLPISLNLAGTKCPIVWPKTACALSMPRLGFNDFWECASSHISRLMPVRRITGAYWDWNLIECIEKLIADHDPEWILTADYDSVFMLDTVYALLDLAMRHPEADAIAPLQTARWHDRPMMTITDANGQVQLGAKREDLQGELLPSATAHFGLTLLRASKLKALPQPWMQRRYGADQCDPDVHFWRHWREQGNTLFTALRVPIGHCQLMVRWPDINLEAIMQTPKQFFESGPPERVWR